MVQIELLLTHVHGLQASNTVAVHEHSFWQLEIPTAGQIDATLPGSRLELKPPLMLLIPPAMPHGFRQHPRCAWRTFKFNASGGPATPRLLGEDDVSRSIRQSLVTLPIQSGTSASTSAAEGLLSALLALLHEEPADQDHPIVAAVRRRVDASGGCHTSVETLCRELGYSPGHVSTVFRSELGMSLKTYLDDRCAGAAAALLAYGDLQVTQVAHMLGFPDVFSFSRFFKRNRGLSPREFRQAIGTDVNPRPSAASAAVGHTTDAA